MGESVQNWEVRRRREMVLSGKSTPQCREEAADRWEDLLFVSSWMRGEGSVT